MTDREKIIKIIDKWASRAVITKINGASVYDQNNAAELAGALIADGIGDVSEWKRRAEVAERALVIMAESALAYAEKAKVTAMTSDGFFSCDKDAQLALLVNDALLKAEARLKEMKEENDD